VKNHLKIFIIDEDFKNTLYSMGCVFLFVIGFKGLECFCFGKIFCNLITLCCEKATSAY